MRKKAKITPLFKPDSGFPNVTCQMLPKNRCHFKGRTIPFYAAFELCNFPGSKCRHAVK